MNYYCAIDQPKMTTFSNMFFFFGRIGDVIFYFVRFVDMEKNPADLAFFSQLRRMSFDCF